MFFHSRKEDEKALEDIFIKAGFIQVCSGKSAEKYYSVATGSTLPASGIR